MCNTLVLANPPFAGALDAETVAKDLTDIVKTRKTELLFLALFLRLLKPGDHGSRGEPGAFKIHIMPVSVDVCLLRRQHRSSDGRRTFTVKAQPAEVELSLPDPEQQFNTGNCGRCGLESLKPEHRTDA